MKKLLLLKLYNYYCNEKIYNYYFNVKKYTITFNVYNTCYTAKFSVFSRACHTGLLTS